MVYWRCLAEWPEVLWRPVKISVQRLYSCSPFSSSRHKKIFACLFKRFSMADTGQSRRHYHETTVDHALVRGLVTAGPVIRQELHGSR